MKALRRFLDETIFNLKYLYVASFEESYFWTHNGSLTYVVFEDGREVMYNKLWA